VDGVNSLSMVKESNPLLARDEARAPLLWSFFYSDAAAEGSWVEACAILSLGMKNGVAFNLNLLDTPIGGYVILPWFGLIEAVSLKLLV
jgi:hypothetical protein